MLVVGVGICVGPQNLCLRLRFDLQSQGIIFCYLIVQKIQYCQQLYPLLVVIIFRLSLVFSYEGGSENNKYILEQWLITDKVVRQLSDLPVNKYLLAVYRRNFINSNQIPPEPSITPKYTRNSPSLPTLTNNKIQNIKIQKKANNNKPPMLQTQYISLSSVYTPRNKRECTDLIWTIISTSFVIAMFVAANIMWDSGKFYKNYASYYGEANQQFCKPEEVLMYQDPADLENYRCLQTCPSSFVDFKGLCLPSSEEKRQSYLDNPEIAVMVYGSQFFKVLLYTTIIGLSFGLLNLSFVYFAPRFSTKVSFISCLILLLTVGILLLVLYDRFWRQVTWLKITISIACFLICLMIIIMIWLYSNQIKIYGIFVDYGITYLQRNCKTFLYIPVFFLFGVGLCGLIVWQHVCYSSKMASSRNLFNMNSGVWGILNIIEFIWGIQFLRDAFNFCVSGNFVDWFFKHAQNGCMTSFKRLICLNWGSVVAGSFFNAFFELPNLFFQLFRCHPNTQCARAGDKCSTSCSMFSIMDLIRTDSYSYINISGYNFCTSSIGCRRLCNNSEMFVGMQSPMKHYRLMIHITYICAAFLISWFIQRYLMEFYGIWNNLMVIVVSLLCMTWFISIYSDLGQAVQTCFLVQRSIESDYNRMVGVDPAFRDDLLHHEKRIRKDGNC